MPRHPSRTRSPRKPLDWAAVRTLALALPGVEEGTSYGTPAFRVRGKFLARLHENGSLVLKVGSMDERDFLLKADPAVIYITEHYRDYPSILVRLDTVRPAVLADLLEQSWRRLASRRLIAEQDSRGGS